MLGQLVRKEILEHLMSLRFAIACSLCLLVVISGLFVRLQDYNQALDDYDTQVRMESKRLDSMRAPWDLDEQGVTVHARPNALKIFVRGISDRYTTSVRVNNASRLRPTIRGLLNPAVPLFPAMDLVAFVGLILSLMAVVFGYDAVSGEKERGTLRLMLSYAVPRDRVLAAKWIGGYVALIVPFLLASVAGAVIVTVQPTVSLTTSEWMRLAATVGLALLYAAAVYSLALCVSCLTPRPATSVMVLLSLWVVLILAVPNLSPHIASMISPAGNPQEAESRVLTTSRDIFDREFREPMKAYDDEHGFPERWWESAPWNQWPAMKPYYERWIHQIGLGKRATRLRLEAIEKIEHQAEGAIRAQANVSRWIGRISPFTCFATAAGELAGAGASQQWRRRDQLRVYQRELMDYAHDECDAMERLGMANEGRYPEPWSQHRANPVPVFQYVPPAAGDYARAVLVDAGILAGATVVLFLLSFVVFLRYDVR